MGLSFVQKPFKTFAQYYLYVKITLTHDSKHNFFKWKRPAIKPSCRWTAHITKCKILYSVSAPFLIDYHLSSPFIQSTSHNHSLGFLAFHWYPCFVDIMLFSNTSCVGLICCCLWKTISVKASSSVLNLFSWKVN
jgi:hypothetical protein